MLITRGFFVVAQQCLPWVKDFSAPLRTLCGAQEIGKGQLIAAGQRDILNQMGSWSVFKVTATAEGLAGHQQVVRNCPVHALVSIFQSYCCYYYFSHFCPIKPALSQAMNVTCIFPNPLPHSSTAMWRSAACQVKPQCHVKRHLLFSSVSCLPSGF